MRKAMPDREFRRRGDKQFDSYDAMVVEGDFYYDALSFVFVSAHVIALSTRPLYSTSLIRRAACSRWMRLQNPLS